MAKTKNPIPAAVSEAVKRAEGRFVLVRDDSSGRMMGMVRTPDGELTADLQPTKDQADAYLKRLGVVMKNGKPNPAFYTE